MFSKSPSKFGSGVSLLWRGNSFSNCCEYLKQSLFSRNRVEISNDDSNIFLYESARSAIFHCLKAKEIGANDEVIVSCFTCDAVTQAILISGATPVYVDINDDLSMSDNDVLSAINKLTKAVIMQDTFGRLGLKESTIKKIRQKGILLLEDYVLSVGSIRNNVKLGKFGDAAFWSLEVSKTVTIGWGGVLAVNDEDFNQLMNGHYKLLSRISIFEDLRRFMQTFFSLLMVNRAVPFGYIFWYVLYGSRIFKRSSSNFNQKLMHKKIGKISRDFFSFMHPRLNLLFDQTHKNYKRLESRAKNLNLEIPVIQEKDEYIVSPRFSVIVNSEQVKNIFDKGKAIGIEIGSWFDECPPRLGYKNSRIHSHANASKISKTIVNFSCHWTLSEDEIIRIFSILDFISQNSYKEK